MDPNANLAEQLRLAREIQDMTDNCPDDGLSDEQKSRMAGLGARLADLVLALNEWISKGAFLPTKWQEKSSGYPRYYLVVKLGSESLYYFVTHGGFDTPAQALDYMRTCHETIQQNAVIVRAMKPIRAVYTHA